MAANTVKRILYIFVKYIKTMLFFGYRNDTIRSDFASMSEPSSA